MNDLEHYREVDLRRLSSMPELATHIAAACQRAHVTLVRTEPALGGTRQFWDMVLEPIAERLPVDEDADTGYPIDRLWSNVAFDPDRQNRFRHSSSAQPLHTDGSYVSEPPPIVFMFCERPAPLGGATLFLDGRDFVSLLASARPALRQQLVNEPVVFRKGGNEVEAAVIAQDSKGPVLRWNYYALADQRSEGARQKAEDLRKFLDELTRRRVPRSIRLERGDAVFFHDARVLHGRDSFSAKAFGDRCLWKGGFRLRT